MLTPVIILDILQNFTIFATDKKHRRIKIICRYQQYEAANLMVARVIQGRVKKGLIWHFQGSGKSLLMVFAAQKMRMHPALGNPTVMIVVDRIDLDTQISATFNAADVPNMIGAANRGELQTLLAQDVRKVIITTIHKFGEADGTLNRRANIIVMVDEAHRTQEGDLGRRMREALPNAFLFGLTGPPSTAPTATPSGPLARKKTPKATSAATPSRTPSATKPPCRFTSKRWISSCASTRPPWTRPTPS